MKRGPALALFTVFAIAAALLALLNPLLAASIVRVMVSLSPILLTVASGLVFKYLFHF